MSYVYEDLPVPSAKEMQEFMKNLEHLILHDIQSGTRNSLQIFDGNTFHADIPNGLNWNTTINTNATNLPTTRYTKTLDHLDWNAGLVIPGIPLDFMEQEAVPTTSTSSNQTPILSHGYKRKRSSSIGPRIKTSLKEEQWGELRESEAIDGDRMRRYDD